jgi:pimeloyl-ACP methyl ester carboxylesterase
MTKLFALALTCVSLAASAAEPPAINVVGSWQGTLRIDPDLEFQVIARITRAKAGGWNATMYVGNDYPIPVDSVLMGGSTIELTSNSVRYKGEINADGTSIRGIWIHGNPRPVDRPLPLELQRATRRTAWSLPPHSSPHTKRYLTVDKEVNLEVLDWGGSGRPVVLLAGLGSNAHVFDEFAPKLTSRYHVYGITRRGFGNSSAPLTGYSADRLGDDVLAVLDALHLEKPILVGHSIAGEELSSVGSRYPQRVAGLIYLDAGYYYAYYDHSVVRDLGVTVDVDELQRKLDQLRFGNLPADPRALIQELLNTDLPGFTQSLMAWQRTLQATPRAPGAAPSSAPVQRLSAVAEDVMAGLERYTSIPVPILAIFAAPHELPPSTGNDPAAIAAADAADDAATGARAQADAFEKGVPTAHVVRLPHASHTVFRSNETDVLREMNAFIGGLPQ